MYDRVDEFTNTAFSVLNGRVFVLGTKAAYALSCR
jgi:hypothetical protein